MKKEDLLKEIGVVEQALKVVHKMYGMESAKYHDLKMRLDAFEDLFDKYY